MKVEMDDYRNEFIGEISKYCIDGDYILFYDEISGGLYRMDKKSYIVEVILVPMEIHKKEIFPVKQILKWKNEIYIIPNNISHEWIVYDIVDKQLRSVLLLSQSYEIDVAVNIGKWIYLIPEKTNHVMVIVEAGSLNIKMINNNWYKNNIGKLEFRCWGYSSFENVIVFPIIGTREIFQIQDEQIIELSLHIKQPIYSISLSENGMWILPSEGNVIFLVNKSGELIDSVEIWTNGFKDMAERFARILVVDRYVCLFPKQGGQILVLDTNNKKWTAIGDEDTPLYRSLFQKTRTLPYWGYYYNEGKLYTLPLQYRFAEINIENKSINYKALSYENVLMEHQYMSWVYWLNESAKTNFVEWGNKSLRDFCEISLEHDIVHNKECIGKNLWMMIKR